MGEHGAFGHTGRATGVLQESQVVQAQFRSLEILPRTLLDGLFQ